MKIEICITGFSHDDVTWPQCKVIIDGQVYTDQFVINNNNIVINANLSLLSEHKLEILQYGKMFGENRTWHTRNVNGVVHDIYLVITDIKFDDVSIKKIWHNGQIENQFNSKQLLDFQNSAPHVEQIHSGYDQIRLSFNGGYVLKFNTPIYDWIIIQQAPLMRIEGKMKESSLTSIVNWRLDYTKGNALEGLYNECIEIWKKIQ